MEEAKVSLSYDKNLQDIAGNLLEVKMVQQHYDPIAERLVAKMIEREAEDRKTTVFKTEIPASTAAVPTPTEPVSIEPAKFARSVTYEAWLSRLDKQKWLLSICMSSIFPSPSTSKTNHPYSTIPVW